MIFVEFEGFYTIHSIQLAAKPTMGVILRSFLSSGDIWFELEKSSKSQCDQVTRAANSALYEWNWALLAALISW